MYRMHDVLSILPTAFFARCAAHVADGYLAAGGGRP